MDAKQGRVLQAFRSAREYLTTHPPVSPAPARFTAQMTALGESIDRLEQGAATQDFDNWHGRQETKRQRELRVALLDDHMRPLAAIARAARRKVPGFTKVIHMPRPNAPHEAVLAHARAMAEAAAPYEQVFVDSGSPPDFLAQLTGAADALKASLTARTGHKVRLVSTTRTVRHEVARGAEAVRQLDAMAAPYYRRDPGLLTGWRNARRVRKVVRGGGDGAEEVAPAPAPAVVQVA